MLTKPNVHRRNTRKLGRGQFPEQTPITVAAVGSGSTASLTFSQPVCVSGPIPLTVDTLTFVSQVISSPTVAVVTMSGAVASKTYSMAANPVNVTGQKGQPITALAGTF